LGTGIGIKKIPTNLWETGEVLKIPSPVFIYVWVCKGMNRLIVIGCMVAMLAANLGFAQLPASSFDILNGTGDLAGYSGSSNIVYVSDAKAGGLFVWSGEKLKPDNGIIFGSKTRSGCWRRSCDISRGVNVLWFGAAGDSVTDDTEPLRRALQYPAVIIPGAIAVSGKLALPAGKTIEMAPEGRIRVLDTFVLNINSFFKAGDYQHIFTGRGRILFGTESVPYVSACWFGAIADNNGTEGAGTDNTQCFQNAIAAAQNVSEVFIPPTPSNRYYRITHTVALSKTLHFFSFTLRGGGTTVTHHPFDRATTLFADFSNGSAINVQGSRRVYLKDMCFIGKNEAVRNLNTFADPKSSTPAVANPRTFIAKGLQEDYAAVTTDADSKSSVWSADVVFENLLIERFCVGIGISQAGKAQGDRIRVRGCQITDCVYGISMGNPQNRGCHFENVDMNRVWCGITNCTFGYHTASMFQLTGGQWCNMYQCFVIQPSNLGQCVISGLYTEATGCIGHTGTHANNGAILFTGCNFSMQDRGLNDGYNYLAPLYTFWSSGNTSFIGCNFWARRGLLAMAGLSVNQGFNGGTITLSGCSIHTATSLYLKGNSSVNNTFLIPDSRSMIYNRSISVELEANGRYNTGYNAESATSMSEWGLGVSDKFTASARVVRKISRIFAEVPIKDRIQILYKTHDTMAFSYPKSLNDSFFKHVLPGDRLGSGVASVRAFPRYDNPVMQVIDIDTAAGTVKALYYCEEMELNELGLFTNTFFTTFKIDGMITVGSNKITHIRHVEGLRDGDFITFDEGNCAYRICKTDLKDSSATITSPIAGSFSGRTTLYNELLIPEDKGDITAEPIKFISENTILRETEKNVIIKNAEHDITVSLPANVTVGQVFKIKKSGVTSRVTVVSANGSIDGKTSVMLTGLYDYISLLFDGTNYNIMN
jgi:hypothetical protein